MLQEKQQYEAGTDYRVRQRWSHALKRLAETLRVERERTADIKAGKIPTMLLAPQMIFGMPSVMLAILFSPLYGAITSLQRMF